MFTSEFGEVVIQKLVYMRRVATLAPVSCVIMTCFVWLIHTGAAIIPNFEGTVSQTSIGPRFGWNAVMPSNILHRVAIDIPSVKSVRVDNTDWAIGGISI